MTATTPGGHGPRMNLAEELPKGYAGLVRLDEAAHANLDDRLVLLVKLRVSQMNGCAYCLDLHARHARELGESQQRLDTLGAWREVPHLFDVREQAALELAESVTRLEPGGVPDAVWDAAAAAFPEPGEMPSLLAAAIAINAWNRVAVPTRTPVAEAP